MYTRKGVMVGVMKDVFDSEETAISRLFVNRQEFLTGRCFCFIACVGRRSPLVSLLLRLCLDAFAGSCWAKAPSATYEMQRPAWSESWRLLRLESLPSCY